MNTNKPLDGFQLAAIAEIIQCEKEIVKTDIELHTNEQKIKDFHNSLNNVEKCAPKDGMWHELQIGHTERLVPTLKSKIKRLHATIKFLQDKYITY